MSTFRMVVVLTMAMIRISPRDAALGAFLLVCVSLTEGLGLLLLMPLLGLVGVEEPNTMPNVTGWFEALFEFVGIEPSLTSVLALFVGIAGARALFYRWQTQLSANVRESFTSAMRIRLYRAIANVEWSYFVTRKSAEFAHVLAGETGRLGVAAAQVIELSVVLAVSAVYVGLAVHLSTSVAVLVLACAALLAWAVRGTLDRARSSGARASSARSRLHSAIVEHMASMKTAKSYGALTRHTDEFLQLSTHVRDVSLEVTTGESELQQSLEFGSTVLLAVIVFIALEVWRIPAASMLVLLFTFSRLMPRLVTVYRRVQTLASVQPVFDSVLTLERECLAAAEPYSAASPDISMTRSLRFDDVSFAYPARPETFALRGISFQIAAGTTAAVVGPSGAGKSTLADLAIGLLTPSAGRILVDDKPLGPDQVGAWRRLISYVPQDTFLFHDTVRANLEWVRPGATDSEIWDALSLAAADTFAESLPKGLDTVVGERGVLVSGGERQRLSLARALLRKPRVLILDEATSSLDSENELRIQQAIARLHQLMTIIVITHRLSTIREADVIHVVDGGRLVQSGSWDALLAEPGGRFRQLCVAQGLEVL